jgi:hypothetical protein
MNTQKILGYFLIILVVLVTIVSLLAIWDIIELHNITGKLFKSLFAIFISSAVLLFIFNVIMGNNDNKKIN